MTPGALRSALLIGTGTADATGRSPTSDHDLSAVSRLLRTRFAFAADEVRLLRGAQADRAGILRALDDVAERCAPGGQVFVYFSGHGALLPDPGDAWGSGAALEPYGARTPADLVSDDVLLAWVARLWDRTTDLHLCIDSCFSGGIDADDVGEQRTDAAEQRYWGSSGWPVDTRYALLSSSRHSLVSATATFPALGAQQQHSLLTGSLGTLLEHSSGPAPTYAELRTLLDARTAALGTPQQPQACGDVHREFLGTVRRPSRRLTRLAGPQTLRLGAAHGVVPGSRWAVQPTGSLGQPGAAAELEVVRVEPLRSSCELVGGTQPPATRDVVAVEVARPACPSGAVRVVLRHAPWLGDAPSTASVDRLVERLSASPLLEVAPTLGPEPFRDDAGEAALTLACSDPYLTVVRDGLLVTHLYDAREASTGDELVQDLEEIARWTWARDVGAPDPTLGETGVRLVLSLAGGDGRFDELGDGPAGEPPTLRCGDVLAVRVHNASDRPVWPTLFHLGMDCTAVRLFPRTPQNRPLPPGGTRSWGFGAAGGWTVGRVAHGNDLRWPRPREQAFKLWVTGDESDLAVLETVPAVARAAGVEPRFEPRAATAPLRTTGGARPAPPGSAAAPTGPAWTTVTRRYLVVPGADDTTAAT